MTSAAYLYIRPLTPQIRTKGTRHDRARTGPNQLRLAASLRTRPLHQGHPRPEGAQHGHRQLGQMTLPTRTRNDRAGIPPA